MLPVLMAGGVLSALYVSFESLFACTVAHAIVDAAGVLLAPALLARRKQQAASAEP